MQLGMSGKLIDVLKTSIQEEYPTLDSGEAFSHANAGISLACPVCGELSHPATLNATSMAGESLRGAEPQQRAAHPWLDPAAVPLF